MSRLETSVGNKDHIVLPGSGRDHRQSWALEKPWEAGTIRKPEPIGLQDLPGVQAIYFASYYILSAGWRCLCLGPKACGYSVPAGGWNYSRPWARPPNPFRSYQEGRVTRCEGPMELQGHAPH